VQQNPETLLSLKVTVQDSKVREVSGTLLQIAARANSFDYTERERGYCYTGRREGGGFVEALSAYLTPEEVKEQLGVVFPPGWEEDMAKRRKAILDVLKEFYEKMLGLGPNKEAPPLVYELPEPRGGYVGDADDMKEIFYHIEESSTNLSLLNGIIREFQENLLTAAKKIGQTGYIFDPEIFYPIVELFDRPENRISWFNYTYEINARKSLFWVVAYDALQGLLVGEDHLLVKTHIRSKPTGLRSILMDTHSAIRDKHYAVSKFPNSLDNFRDAITQKRNSLLKLILPSNRAAREAYTAQQPSSKDCSLCRLM
jgi:hypothetical protein